MPPVSILNFYFFDFWFYFFCFLFLSFFFHPSSPSSFSQTTPSISFFLLPLILPLHLLSPPPAHTTNRNLHNHLPHTPILRQFNGWKCVVYDVLEDEGDDGWGEWWRNVEDEDEDDNDCYVNVFYGRGRWSCDGGLYVSCKNVSLCFYTSMGAVKMMELIMMD